MLNLPKTPEVNIVFSGSFIQANMFSAFLCIVLPILFLWYYKRKTGVKISAFFIGAAFCLLFTYLVTYILNILVLSVSGLGGFLSSKNHPVYSAIYGSCSIGLVSTIGSLIGLKYAMKTRPGRENALVFGVGMGGFESILNGGTVYITNIIAALLINSVGSAEYFKKLGLTGKELTETQSLFASQADTPASFFLMDATYMILSLILYGAIALFVCRAISKKETGFIPAAIILHILGYVPMYLTHIEAFKNSVVLFGIATVYTFVVAFLAYRIYHSMEETIDSLPKRG